MQSYLGPRFMLAVVFCATLLLVAQQSNADDKLKKMIKSTGMAKIKILEADVPDMDPYPTQGDSDTFVRVSLASKPDEVLCETPIVQDKDDPRVSRFFHLTCL